MKPNILAMQKKKCSFGFLLNWGYLLFFIEKNPIPWNLRAVDQCFHVCDIEKAKHKKKIKNIGFQPPKTGIFKQRIHFVLIFNALFFVFTKNYFSHIFYIHTFWGISYFFSNLTVYKGIGHTNKLFRVK